MIKVGIWGCGGISSFHRRAYEELEKSGLRNAIISAMDVCAEKSKKMQEDTK